MLKAGDIARLREAFPDTAYYVPPDETLRAEVARGVRGAFNLIHHATLFKADIYIAARDPLHAWALAHRRRVTVAGLPLWIAPPEYVVLRKLEFLREGGQDKHVRDIRYIRAATELDLAFIEREVARLGLRAQWEQCAPEAQ